MTAIGAPQDDIALVLGISAKTLRKHYPKEVKLGTILANAAVGGALYTAATTKGPGQITAGIFWAKTRMGWRETSTVALVGADGGPLEVRRITRTIISATAIAAAQNAKAKKG
jgi:hypothetical protein